MFLNYTPEGQPAQQWHFTPGRLKSAEMIAIEKRTGTKWGQFVTGIELGGVEELKALLWTFLRRTHHTLKYEDVDFYGDELELIKDVDELADEIKSLDDLEGIPADQRAAGMDMLRLQMRTAPPAPGKARTATTAAPEPEPLPQARPAVEPLPDPTPPPVADVGTYQAGPAPSTS